MWRLFKKRPKKKMYPKCIRCGVCCLMGPCIFGNENGFGGICRHLEVHPAGTTSCTTALKGMAVRRIVHGKGCVLRTEDGRGIYKEATELVAKRKDALYDFQNSGGCVSCQYPKDAGSVPSLNR